LLWGGRAFDVDIVRRTDDVLHLYEVKSGVSDDAQFIDDMAYTAPSIVKLLWWTMRPLDFPSTRY